MSGIITGFFAKLPCSKIYRRGWERLVIIPVLGHFTSYDGTVVHSFRHRMRDYLERMARYDLIFGVASADALVFALNDKELEYGIEMNGRNRILSDFVASNYKVRDTLWFMGVIKDGPRRGRAPPILRSVFNKRTLKVCNK